MDEHFGANVNLNCSTIHIPSSIYDKREQCRLKYVIKATTNVEFTVLGKIGDDILEGVHWTSSLDEVFKTNYEKNPTLLWQYFAR